MDNFLDFITEQKNTHMTHIEDKVLYGGVNGTRQAIMALRELRDILAGKVGGDTKAADVTVKPQSPLFGHVKTVAYPHDGIDPVLVAVDTGAEILQPHIRIQLYVANAGQAVDGVPFV